MVGGLAIWSEVRANETKIIPAEELPTLVFIDLRNERYEKTTSFLSTDALLSACRRMIG